MLVLEGGPAGQPCRSCQGIRFCLLQSAGDSDKTVVVLRTLLLLEATPEMAYFLVSAARSTGWEEVLPSVTAGTHPPHSSSFPLLFPSYQTCIILRDMRINLAEATIFTQWHKDAHVSSMSGRRWCKQTCYLLKIPEHLAVQAMYNYTMDLRAVCNELSSSSVIFDPQTPRLGLPALPQLALPLHSLEDVIATMVQHNKVAASLNPGAELPFLCEPKLDGAQRQAAAHALSA